MIPRRENRTSQHKQDGYQLSKITKILSSIKTEYDGLLVHENPDVQYFLDIIKAKIAFNRDLLPLENIHTISNEFRKNPRFTSNPTDDLTELWSKEMIEQLIDNIKLLKKQHVLNPEKAYSAIMDSLVAARPHAPPKGSDADVFCYLIQHPMTTYTAMAQALGRNRSTIHDSMKRLEAKYWIRTMARNDLTPFGLRSCILFAKLKESVDWEPLRERLFTYPFLKSIHKVSNSRNVLIVFILPSAENIVTTFERSLKRIASKLFDYYTFHLFEGSSRSVNPSLLKDGSWELPECIVKERIKPPKIYEPVVAITKAHGLIKELVFEDFLVQEIFSVNMRMNLDEARQMLHSKEVNISKRKISQIRNHLIEQKILVPFLWFGRVGFHYDITVEIVCDKKTRDHLLKVFTGFPQIASCFVSDVGIILFLETPQYHLLQYIEFLNSVRNLDQVISLNTILSINAPAGRPNSAIYEELKYDIDGYATASTDVSITEYLLK